MRPKLLKTSGEVRTTSAPARYPDLRREELELLAAHLRNVEDKPREIAARARQARRPSLGHRIRLKIHADDGNRLGRLGRGLDRGRSAREDDVDAGGNELGGEVGKLLVLVGALWGSEFEEEVLSRHVPHLLQTLEERLHGRSVLTAEISDPRNLRRSLSARAPTRDEEPEANDPDECPPGDHAITGV